MQSAIQPISELRRTFEQSTYCCNDLPLGELVVISTLLKRHGDIKLLTPPAPSTPFVIILAIIPVCSGRILSVKTTS